jgi:3'-phosphoadenosine 5'-phosphosulfate sulfotransferase (PAPS reductase)/FAD synthetase
MAGVKPDDLDFVETYDDYPVISLMQLEDLGFCRKGDGAAFVRSRSFTWDGDFPLNTSGGQLSVGQAGAAGGFLGMVAKRQKWPDSQRRLCTSTLKRDALTPLFTEFVDELNLPAGEQAIILNVFGIRAEESPARRLKKPLSVDARASSANRLILAWNIIHHLTESEVWQEIAANRLEYHEVYDADLPRLSCIFCVLAGVRWLTHAARICFTLGMDAPRVWARLEAEIGHSFKQNITLADIIADARRLDAEEGPLTWRRGDALRRALGEQAAGDYLRAVGLAA